MKKISMVCILWLAGCAETSAVSDYNGSSVKIQQTTYFVAANHADPMVTSEAERICKTSGKRSEYASTIQLPNYRAEHLFLCL